MPAGRTDKDAAELARLNYVFFDDATKFEESADSLAEALLNDIDWVRKHTEYGELARRWSQAGRPGPKGLLLRPPVLEEDERWIASRPAEAPLPTEATQAFVAESRLAHTAGRNRLMAGLGGGLLVTLFLGGLALWQRSVAVENETIAVNNATIADRETKTARGKTSPPRLRRLPKRDWALIRCRRSSWRSPPGRATHPAISAGRDIRSTCSGERCPCNICGVISSATRRTFSISNSHRTVDSFDRIRGRHRAYLEPGHQNLDECLRP